jgi:hypothetical protein
VQIDIGLSGEELGSYASELVMTVVWVDFN